jgi:uncharacterized membrane protein
MNTLTTLALNDHYGPGGWWPIFWLLVIVGLLVFFATRRRHWHEHAGTRSGHARLAERYAAGEIDDDEYRTRRAVLNEKSGR